MELLHIVLLSAFAGSTNVFQAVFISVSGGGFGPLQSNSLSLNITSCEHAARLLTHRTNCRLSRCTVDLAHHLLTHQRADAVLMHELVTRLLPC
jgi:hypothetical protein